MPGFKIKKLSLFKSSRLLEEEINKRSQLEKQLKIQYDLTRILANTERLEEMSAQFLQAVCQELQWEIGAIWRVDQAANLLRCVGTWHVPSSGFHEFEAVTHQITLAPGIDLPGRVWKNNAPDWVPDMAKELSSPRATCAQSSRLHTGCAFPIRLKGKVVGIIEFFSHQFQEPDENVLTLFDILGNQIGQFMQHKQLQMEQIHLGAIVESSEDSIIGINLFLGVITSWNQGAERMYGYKAQEIIGKSMELLVPPEKVEDLSAIIFQIMEQNKGLGPYETVRVAQDGHLMDVSLVVSPVRDSEGHIMGISAIERDITQRKKTEQELVLREKTMRELLRDVQESKEQLETQHKELEEKNKQLQKLAVLKDEFVATVSHELRTPLTAIKEGISLFFEGALGGVSPEQKDFLKTVDENVDRLGELINHMLDLSKIEAGRMRLFRKRMSLQPMIKSALDVYRPLAGTRTLKLEGELVPDVFSDQNRIFQVIGNLLSNAIKFTKENGTIVVSLKTLGDFVSISVQDDGIGISKSDIPKLFQKFSQIEKGAERPRGTGLGLALLKELVEMHQGTVEVSSVPGQGSTFAFTLPIYTPQHALENNLQEAIDFAKRYNQETVGMTVIDCVPLTGRLFESTTENPIQSIEKIADLISTLVHGDDLVVPIDPRWVVILSVVDAMGLQAISDRIRTILRERTATCDGNKPQELPLHIGTALYPTDGTDAQDLFSKITHTLLPA